MGHNTLTKSNSKLSLYRASWIWIARAQVEDEAETACVRGRRKMTPSSGYFTAQNEVDGGPFGGASC
jgi:hypothetical protein